jgi:hypothetical protein
VLVGLAGMPPRVHVDGGVGYSAEDLCAGGRPLGYFSSAFLVSPSAFFVSASAFFFSSAAALRPFWYS